MEKTPLTVSQSLALINQTLEYAHPVLLVEGEVSSFKVNRDKYVFFDLKDDEASMGCFMTVWQLRMPLEDGMKVQVVASPRLTAWGKFSLTVREVRPIGAGSIKRSFEMLKTKLQAEGLFASERKKPLPPLPHRIGLIASVESAGYIDFLTILGSRWGCMQVVVANVQVQGTGAAEQVVRALEYFNGLASPPEIIVIVRGGGSADDLAVFNDEPLVRAVAASWVPVLSGVGHEVDVSLVDLAADVRAATPSNAAERLTPDKRDIMLRVKGGSDRLGELFARRLDGIHDHLERSHALVDQSLSNRLATLRQSIGHKQLLLDSLNPTNILRQGYALLRDIGGRPLKRTAISTITPGDELQIELMERILKIGVDDVWKKDR